MSEKDLIIENLKTLRALEKLTVDQFAERINVPRHNLVKYLGRSVPPHDVIRTISNTFNLDIHQFYCKRLTEYNYNDFKLKESKANSQLVEGNDELKTSMEILLDERQIQDNKRQASYNVFKLVEQLTAENKRLKQIYLELVKFLKSNKIIDDIPGLK